MRSPYSWMGGKFYEKKFIIPLMPVHEWYAETFAGSGILLLNKPQSKEEFMNDKFSCLVSFWKTLQNYELAKQLKRKMLSFIDSLQEYQDYMRMNPEELKPVDRAYRFLYLTTFGFNSYMDTYYTPISHKIGKIKDHRRVWRNNAGNLLEISKRVQDVGYTNLDFRVFLKKIIPHPDKFIFLDPPYIDTHQYNRGYGENLNFEKSAYVDMRNELKRHHEGGTRWMITCNQINEYFDEMDDVIITYIDRRACINKNEERKRVKTKVVMNYDVNELGSCLLMRDKKEGDFMEV